jgi:hypothetical protein
MKSNALVIPAALAALALLTGAAFASQPATQSGNSAAGGKATRALNLLEAKGYSNFWNFQPQGNDFTAKVEQQNHRTVTLLIDPSSGTVRPED